MKLAETDNIGNALLKALGRKFGTFLQYLVQRVRTNDNLLFKKMMPKRFAQWWRKVAFYAWLMIRSLRKN